MKTTLLVLLLSLITSAIACSSSDPTPTATTPTEAARGPSIEILSPEDGFVSTTGVAPVRIRADENLSISVNGQLANPEVGGIYSIDLLLEDGANLIEIVGTSLDGTTASVDRAVFNVTPVSTSPLDVYFPSDGHVSSSQFVQIVGSTSPGSSVSLNGQLVTPSSLGIFDEAVELNDGPNLVEVATVGLDGSSTTQSIAVFVKKT